MAQQEVLIPDIGDAEDVEVIEILAKVGAHIAKDDPLIVIESDKASMEVPASVSGTLRKITVALGDKVRTGQAIAVVEIESTNDGSGQAAPTRAAQAVQAPTQTAQVTNACAPANGLNFVCRAQNPEDLVPIPDTRWLIASGMREGAGLNQARGVLVPQVVPV